MYMRTTKEIHLTRAASEDILSITGTGARLIAYEPDGTKPIVGVILHPVIGYKDNDDDTYSFEVLIPKGSIVNIQDNVPTSMRVLGYGYTANGQNTAMATDVDSSFLESISILTQL